MIRTASRYSVARTSIRCGRTITLAAALSASGCTPAAPPNAPSTTLTIATAIPRTRDPGTGVRAIIDMLTLEAPLAIGWDGSAVPRAIDRWDWSPDGLTLRLRLRSGAVFHDGTALTNRIAADILRDALQPENFPVSATVESVEPEGTDGIVVRTTQPEGFLLSDISIANFSLPGKPHVGTGPFRLESDAGPIVLRAFDRYPGGRPPIDTVRIAEYETQRQAWTAMMRGEADLLYDVSVDSLDFVEAESMVQTHSFLRSYYHALVFNLKLPLFTPRDVRRALNTAVDREEVVKVALRTHGIPSDGPIWPEHFARSSQQPAYGHDPRAAEAMLDGLGLTVARGRQPGLMPSRFRFTCLVAGEDQRLHRIALVLQKQLFKISVDMAVEVRPIREVQQRVAQGRFDAFLWEFGSLRSLAFVYTIWRSPAAGAPSRLNLHYTSADDALDRLRAALNPDAVRAAVGDVQRAFHDDPPAIFLEWMQTTRALSRGIEVPDEKGRDILASIQKWRPVQAGRSR